MADHDYPETIVVDWCITAKVKGKGKPLTYTAMGGAEEATDLMIDWLQGLDLGDEPKIDLTAELSSDQLPDASHNLESDIDGLPAGAALAYQIDWLSKIKTLDNWGGGGGP